MTKLSAALAPLLLQADNFTHPARTPWGGRRIVGRYKAQLGLASELADEPVGESWELSLGPELPSRTEDGRMLGEVVAASPQAWLGREHHAGASALLVKWLDAAEPLSVQIHPAVGDPDLAPGETGKPECWYIVERAAGAGLYLGLKPGVSRARMAADLAAGADISQLLEFVPVEPGDFFLLQPGMPHAVGPGVTLIEPQYVAPGRRGVTLRYWDWNRRYDARGKPSREGDPRELHIQRALDVTDWARASDPTWLAAQRCSTRELDPSVAASCEVLCGAEPQARVRSEHLRAARLLGDGALALPDWQTLRALTVIGGEVVLRGAFGALAIAPGRTAALPAALGALRCELRRAHALLSSVVAAA